MTTIVKTFALLLVSSVAYAQHGMVDQTPVDQNIRLGVVHDREVTPSGASATGIEIGYAQQMLPLDQMVFTFSHLGKGQVEHNSMLISFEDHYKLAANLKLYGTSGIGYMITDLENGSERTGLIGKLGVGLLLETCSRSALYAEVSYQLSGKDLWFNGDRMDNDNMLFSAGLRWFY